jgi:hypothetical protein
VNSLVRIKNVGTDTGKGMTDALGQAGPRALPERCAPDYFIMNRRSRRQLTQSRQPFATGALPTNVIVPLATEIEGIPLLVTDAISNNEGTL